MITAIPNSLAPHRTGNVTASSQTLAQVLGVALQDHTDSVVISFEGDVRISVNNTAPTGTAGVLFQSGAVVEFTRQEAAAMRLIRGSAASSNVPIQVAQYAQWTPAS